MEFEMLVHTGAAPIGWRNWVNLIAYTLNTAVTYSAHAGMLAVKNTMATPVELDVWGPIFVWEGIFVVAQLLPCFRDSQVVLQMSPWWWSLCFCQVARVFAFTCNYSMLASMFMLCILASLLGSSWSTDGLPLSTAEHFLLPPFSGPIYIQVGWIIMATALNVSTHMSTAKSPEETLLEFSVVSNGVVLLVVAIFTFDLKNPNPLIGVMAASALAAIYSDPEYPVNGNDQYQFNITAPEAITYDGLGNLHQRNAFFVISVFAITVALVLVASRIRTSFCDAKFVFR